AALGYGSLHFVDGSTPLPALLVPFLLIPSGMGFAVPAMTTAVLASVEPARAGIASAVLNTARQAGGAIGVAAFGAVAGRGGAVPVVDGLRIDTGVSVALLIAAALLATRVRPDAHRDAHRDAHGGRRPLQTTD
ncbi:MFS transporter, partial [Burkholderia multivorans]